jgi:hypothetical protein
MFEYVNFIELDQDVALLQAISVMAKKLWVP